MPTKPRANHETSASIASGVLKDQFFEVPFIQTWNDDKRAGPLNPRVENYPIFMATSQHGGKDNSGEYIYRMGLDNAPELDSHHHMIVEHDLDVIAAAFLEFGRKQNLEFCKESG